MWRTTEIILNLSCHHSRTFKIPDPLPAPTRHFHVLQTVPYTEIITTQNKDSKLYESNSGYLQTSIVYIWKKHVLAIPTHSESHTQNNNSSSANLWSSAPQRSYTSTIYCDRTSECRKSGTSRSSQWQAHSKCVSPDINCQTTRYLGNGGQQIG
jgi:hypothetical protein